MPLVTFLVFDNITPAQEATNRIGSFCLLCDNSGSANWGPVYEDLDAPGGAKYAVEWNSTLEQSPGVARLWTAAATVNNNPHGTVALLGDPLFSESELTEHLQQIQFDDFVEHDYTVPPEEEP